MLVIYYRRQQDAGSKVLVGGGGYGGEDMIFMGKLIGARLNRGLAAARLLPCIRKAVRASLYHEIYFWLKASLSKGVSH